MNRAPEAYCGCFVVYVRHVAAVICFSEYPLPHQQKPLSLKHRC